ncbi:MAG: glycosyltransferase family 4 protein [bacterium]|nr:glycosyltransferase family 4 protein [bacterium]
MRVALIIEWLDAARGGAETSTGQFVRHLVTRGVELTVFTRSDEVSEPGTKLHTIPVHAPTRSQQARAFVRQAASEVRAGHFDVVHSVAPCLAADVYEPRGGTIIETARRNLATRPPGWRRISKRAANLLNPKQQYLLKVERQLLGGGCQPLVVAISDYVVRQLREHYDYPMDRIRPVFNGVEPDQTDLVQHRRYRAEVRQRHGIGEDEYLVIMVAHNFRLKGLARWLEACDLLARKTSLPLRSLIVGRGRVAPWERAVARRGLSDRVGFTGPASEVVAYYHAADVLVHPTYYDPCSRVVLEALTAGLPVITTRYDGAAEVIEDGVNGFVVGEDECVRNLADRVERLEDGALRAKIGGQAAELADRVSMARHAEGVCRVYSEVSKSR